MPEEPQSESNAIASRMIAKAQAKKAAVEAVRASMPPDPAEPAEPAEPPPAEAAPAPQPAPTAEPPPPPPPVTPDAPPQEPPKPAPKPPEAVNAPPGDAPERSWQALHSAEKRLAEDKRAFEEAKKNAPAPSADLKADPIGALRAAGWTEDQIAQMLVTRAESGAWQPQQQPPQSQPAPAPAAAPPEKPKEENDALIARLGNLEAYVIKQDWALTAAQNEEFGLINSVPGGVDFALERAALHMESTGQSLTPQEGLAMAQSELIEREKQRLETLRANPLTAEALGLTGSPASPAPTESPAAPPESTQEPPLTTLSNDVAATPGQPPVPADNLNDKQRHKRAVDAIRQLRRAAEM